MIKVTFTEQAIDQLFRERYEHPHPLVQRRMEALYLKSQGLKNSQIAMILRMSRRSLQNWMKVFEKEGVEGLKKFNYKGQRSKLHHHTATLEDYFRKHPPRSIQEASCRIEELTGLKRGETPVRKFLKSMGMSLRKTGAVPGKADPAKQEEFKKKTLEPVLADAREGKKEVYFVDAAHFVWQGFLGFLWCFAKIWVKSPSGRQRFNVLGALNAITKETITITNTTYINAWSVIELLFKLRQRCQTTGIPITIVLDNCGYQTCNLVRAAAKMMSIELIFLPSYSPNLNLIERLWKFIKKKSLNSREYSNFEAFCDEITRCIENAHKEYRGELENLLTLRFQTLPAMNVSNHQTLERAA